MDTVTVILIGSVIIIPLWMVIISRWQRGIYLLFCATPFLGILILLTKYSPAALLFKDYALVLPLYVACYIYLRESAPFPGIPRRVLLCLYLFIILVIVQIFNPNVPHVLVALVGTKVWLFYTPLLLVAYAQVKNVRDILTLLRLPVALAIIPTIIGIAEYALSQMFGYEKVMKYIYGYELAPLVTQGYTGFQFGGGTLYRIPSTFTFVAQFSCYLQVIVTVSYMLMYIDHRRTWRLLGRAVFFLSTAASILCGQRGMFIYLPLLIGTAYFLHHGIKGIFKALCLLVLIWQPTSWLTGLSIRNIYPPLAELVLHYTEDLAVGQTAEMAILAPVGGGTGVSTNPARHVYRFSDVVTSSELVGAENYFAKAIVELGLLGGLLILGIHLTNITVAFRCRLKATSPQLRAITSVLTAFFFLITFQSFKGSPLDVDPINFYYWCLAGVLYRINYIVGYQTIQTRQMSTDKIASPSPAAAKGFAEENTAIAC